MHEQILHRIFDLLRQLSWEEYIDIYVSFRYKLRNYINFHSSIVQSLAKRNI